MASHEFVKNMLQEKMVNEFMRVFDERPGRDVDIRSVSALNLMFLVRAFVSPCSRAACPIVPCSCLWRPA